MTSDCCNARIVMGDICSRCKEHCEVGFYGSDDGYDAAREAFNNGYGPPVTRRQRREEQEEYDEFRRSGW
jgi:hypothetical protein